MVTEQTPIDPDAPARALYRSYWSSQGLTQADFDVFEGPELPDWRGHALAVAHAFVQLVNARAEASMLRTGVLEGSHHTAIQAVLAEMEAQRDG